MTCFKIECVLRETCFTGDMSFRREWARARARARASLKVEYI